MKNVYEVKLVEGYSKFFTSNKKAVEFIAEYFAHNYTMTYEREGMKAFIIDSKLNDYKMSETVIVQVLDHKVA